MIVDTGDGETYELLWIWRNVMTNCGERDNPRIKYPKFNRKFDAMQEAFFRLLWDFGVDEKKLSPTVMLSIVGTMNTKTGIRRSIVGEADEVLTYEELASRLGLNFGEVRKENHEQQAPEAAQPEHEEVQERLPIEVAETMSRASEVVEPKSKIAKFLTELAEYTDFEIITMKQNSQNQQVLAIQEADEPPAEAEEIPAPETQLNQPVAKIPNDSNIALDLWRLHHDSEYIPVNTFTQNKAKGKRGQWMEYWTPASRVFEKLAELRRTIPDFEGEDYDFEEFARAIEAFVLAPEKTGEPIRVSEAEVKAEGPKSEKPAVKGKSGETNTAKRSRVEAQTTNRQRAEKNRVYQVSTCPTRRQDVVNLSQGQKFAVI